MKHWLARSCKIGVWKVQEKELEFIEAYAKCKEGTHKSLGWTSQGKGLSTNNMCSHSSQKQICMDDNTTKYPGHN